MAAHPGTEKIMAEVQAILNTSLPVVMLDPVKRLCEIVSVLQGEIVGLADSIVDHEIKIRTLERQLNTMAKIVKFEEVK